MLKVNNRNTRARCEICSKLTIKTPERRHWRQVFVSFYYSKIYVFLFSLLIMIHWRHKFLETMQSHWGFTYYRTIENYSSPLVVWFWFQLIQKYLSKEIIIAWNRKIVLKKTFFVYYRLCDAQNTTLTTTFKD